MCQRIGENASARYYGPADSRFIKIGRGTLYQTIHEVVKTSSQRQATDEEIQKAIREGVNTIHLHDKDVRMRANARLVLEELGDNEKSASFTSMTD